MAIRTALWKVSTQPQALIEAQLPSEKLLEDMIVAAPKVLSDEWMLIGPRVLCAYRVRRETLPGVGESQVPP